MIINLIRHGMTPGNVMKKYIGRTDESLLDSERERLATMESVYPACDILFSSPMKRCIQTAEIIYPAKTAIIIDEYRECDFGKFEGHGYEELNGDEDYQRWVDSGGTMDFPEGEAIAHFKNRVINGFDRMVSCTNRIVSERGVRIRGNDTTVSCVVHGGTIMALLEHYEMSHEYYRWQVKNGCGFVCETSDDMSEIRAISTIG